MADYLVSNNLDSGDGSLRQAIVDANANWITHPGDASTITFGLGVANQTIELLGPLPAIAGDLTIDGAAYDPDQNPSTQNITISGGDAARVFFVLSGEVHFQYFTIADGQAAGGAGASGGGGGLGAGAAIFVNAGNTIVTNVNFSNDHATGGDAGAGASTSPGGGGGGGRGGGAGSGGGG